MVRRLALVLAVICGLVLPARAGELSAKDAKEVRTLLRTALEDPSVLDSAETKKRVAAWAETGGPDGVAKALAAGPLLAKDALAPRTRDGAKETLAEFDGVRTGWSFTHDGITVRYAVALPKGYDPKKPCGVLLDPGHGIARKEDQKGKAGYASYYVGLARAAGLDDWIVVRTEIVEQVGVDGARGAWPEDRVVGLFDALFRDLATRVAIDPDRVIVTGLSQTGFWAWQLGVSRSDRFSGVAPMGAVSGRADLRLENLRNVPVRVLHGGKDTTCPPSQPRSTCARLERMGFDVEYLEFPDAGHTPAVWGRLRDVLPDLGARKRVRHPTSVSLALGTLQTRWSHWLRVDGLAREGSGAAGDRPTAGLDGRIDGQTVHLASDGVTAVSVHLAPELLDLTEPVTVIWNGETVFEGTPEPDPLLPLRVAVEKVDWSATYTVRIEVRAPK